MIRRLLRRLFPGCVQGGRISAYRPRPGERLVALSPGGLDYDPIARLERGLGIVVPEPERSIRLARTVCLTKNCGGETVEVRTWSGMLAVRIHGCE